MSTPSPSKRLKSNERISRITSTPQNRSLNNGGGGSGAPSRAPSISTIYRSSPSIGSSGTSIQFDSEHETTLSTINDNSDRGIDDVLKRFQWKGIWLKVEPKDHSLLLYQISQKPQKIRTIVTELIEENQENLDLILVAIFKLLTNACGIQGDEINNQTVRDIKALVTAIEHSKKRETMKHIFMKATEAGWRIFTIFSQFFINFIEIACNAQILYHDDFQERFFDFILTSIRSRDKQVRIPFVIAACSMLTGCIRLYRHYPGNRKNMPFKSNLEKSVDFFYLIFNANWYLIAPAFTVFLKVLQNLTSLEKAALRIGDILQNHRKRAPYIHCFNRSISSFVPDPDFYTLRLYCIQHLIEWVKLFPQVFINKRRCLTTLFKLTEDASVWVRLATLGGLKKLLENEDLTDYLTPHITSIFHYLSERSNDVDVQITKKSLNVLTAMLPQYHNCVTLDIKLQIVKIIFQDNTESAQLAGKFIVKYLRTIHNNPAEFVIALVKLASLKNEFTDLMAMLAEACMDHCSELTNWSFLIEMIIKAPNVKVKKSIVELLCEMIRYKLTGSFSMQRCNVKNGAPTIDESDHLIIAETLLPRFQLLYDVLKDEEICLIQLSEVLLIIDFEECKVPHLINAFAGILRCYIDLINEATNRNVLDAVSKVLDKFYKFDRNIQESLDEMIRCLIAEYKTQIEDITNSEVRKNIIQITLKISILFSVFDLTEFIRWEEIFCFTNNKNLNILKYLPTCCKWYVIWSLRHYIENDSIDHLSLKKKSYDFINACLGIIKVSKFSVKPVHFRVFEDLSELYSTIGVLLHNDLSKYRPFVFKITDEAQQKQLVDFMGNCLLENKAVPLDCRRRCLANVVDMLYQAILPADCFSFFMKYYSTHFDDYRHIIENILENLYEKKMLPLAILDTLAVVYEKLLIEQTIVNVNSVQAKLITDLAKRFSWFIKSKNIKDSLMQLLIGAVNFAFQSRRNYEFLYFIRCYIDYLSSTEKDNLRKIFVKKIPKEDRRHEIILVINNYLKKH